MSNVCQIITDITIDTLDKSSYTLDILATNIEHETMEMNMAASTGLNEKAGQNERRNHLPTYSGKPICGRCGGLLVQDFCTDLLNSTGELDCSIARCVQCGDVVDPVIQRNRQLHQDIQAPQPSRAPLMKPALSHYSTEARRARRV
jgi:hypothetical protein